MRTCLKNKEITNGDQVVRVSDSARFYPQVLTGKDVRVQ